MKKELLQVFGSPVRLKKGSGKVLRAIAKKHKVHVSTVVRELSILANQREVEK